PTRRSPAARGCPPVRPWAPTAGASRRRLQLGERADHVERRLGDALQLVAEDRLAVAEQVVEPHGHARHPRELLRDVEGLGEVALEPPGAGHDALVLLAELV